MVVGKAMSKNGIEKQGIGGAGLGVGKGRVDATKNNDFQQPNNKSPHQVLISPYGSSFIYWFCKL